MSKPNFISQKIINKKVGGNHEIEQVLTRDKPIYVGLSILDLSKLLLYDFRYKYIGTKYDNSAKLFMDTDSLAYEIETNVYKDFYENKKLFDFIDYAKD